MDQPDNPYAAPIHSASDPVTGAGSSVIVDGNLLRVGPQVQLPPVCILTGDTEDVVRLERKINYCGPLVYVFFLLSPLIGIIVYLILKKTTKVTVYMNREVRFQRRIRIMAGVLLLFAAAGVFIGVLELGYVDASLAWALLPLAVFLVGIILIAQANTVFTVSRYQKPGEFWLKGGKDPFFAALDPAVHNIQYSGF